MTGTTRRQFLALGAGAGVAALAVAFRPWNALVASASPPSTAQRLAGLFADPRSARLIGREYLRGAPGEASAGRLVELIAGDVPGGQSALAAAPDPGLHAFLGARIVDDFARGETAELQGWVLSVTEARLCALTAVV